MKKPVRKEIENSNVVAFERTFRGIKVTVSTTERVSSQICHVLDDQTMNSWLLKFYVSLQNFNLVKKKCVEEILFIFYKY